MARKDIDSKLIWQVIQNLIQVRLLSEVKSEKLKNKKKTAATTADPPLNKRAQVLTLKVAF